MFTKGVKMASSDQVKILELFYVALNDGDVPKIMALCDEHIERIEPPGFPTSGVYRGRANFEKHLTEARATWAEGCCTPERFESSGAKVVAFVHVRVKLKATQNWVEGRVADAFALRDGQITFMQTFLDPRQARAWAGLAEG